MARRLSFITILLLVAGFIGIAPPPVWASTTFVQNHWSSASPGSSTMNTPTSAVTSGNLLVGMVFCQKTSNDATTTISDTQGNTWNLANITNGYAQANGASSQFTRVNEWYTTASATGSDTITFGCTTTQDTIWSNVDEFLGAGTLTIHSDHCGTTTGTTFKTSTPCSGGNTAAFTSNYVAVAAVFCSSCNPITPGANYVDTPELGGQADSEYSVTGLVSPTDFPSTGPNSYWNVLGVAISGPESVTTAYKVIACTAFQLQCWWYPMVFFGVYSGVFMMIGGAGKVSPRGLTFLLLAGLTFASLTMVLMDMINIMVPLMLTALTTLFMVRTR